MSEKNNIYFYYTYCDAEDQVDIFASGEHFLSFLQDNDAHGLSGSFLWTQEGWEDLKEKSTQAEYARMLEDYNDDPEMCPEPDLESMRQEECFCIGVNPRLFKEISGINVEDYFPDLSTAKEADLGKLLTDWAAKDADRTVVTEIVVPEDPG